MVKNRKVVRLKPLALTANLYDSGQEEILEGDILEEIGTRHLSLVLRVADREIKALTRAETNLSIICEDTYRVFGKEKPLILEYRGGVVIKDQEKCREVNKRLKKAGI